MEVEGKLDIGLSSAPTRIGFVLLPMHYPAWGMAWGMAWGCRHVYLLL
jgi:hypothetical protein